MSSAKIKISTARYVAMNQAPYFATMLYKLMFHEVPLGTLPSGGKGTLAMTPKGNVLYEAEAVARWTERQLAAVIIHELNHLIRHHTKRMGVREPRKWNLACDAEINDDLQAMRLALPDVPVVPELFGCTRGGSAEEYYQSIPDQAEQEQGNKPGGVGHGQCGSCADGKSNDAADEKDKDSGRTETEMEVARESVAAAVRDFAKHGRGTLPAGLARWAEDRLKPARIPWEHRLARACRKALESQAGMVDMEFTKISRKQAAVGFGPGFPIFPTFTAPVVNVAVGLDTSGSMSKAEILLGASETAGIMRASGQPITFLACDAAMHAIKKVHSPSQLSALIKGGGGTDFHPIFKAVENLRPRPNIFVFITDGGGPAPAKPPPGVHVIWLLCGPYRCKPHADSWGSRQGEVKYGEFIEMDTTDKAER